jgi:hypothetical protein
MGGGFGWGMRLSGFGASKKRRLSASGQKTTVISERAGWGCRQDVAPGGVGSIPHNDSMVTTSRRKYSVIYNIIIYSVQQVTHTET